MAAMLYGRDTGTVNCQIKHLRELEGKRLCLRQGGSAFTAGNLAAEDDSTQTAEFETVFVAELIEQAGRFFVDERLHGIQQLQPFCGDDRYRLALIFAAARALHQFPPLQTIDQPGDVGGAIEHAAGDLAAGVAAGVHTAKNAQHIVLRARDAVLFADAVHHVVESVGGDDHTQQGFLGSAGELRLFQPSTECLGHNFFITTNESCVIRAAWGSEDFQAGEVALLFVRIVSHTLLLVRNAGLSAMQDEFLMLGLVGLARPDQRIRRGLIILTFAG